MSDISQTAKVKALEAEAHRRGLKFHDLRDLALAADGVNIVDGEIHGTEGALDHLIRNRPHLLVDGKTPKTRTSSPSADTPQDTERPSAMSMTDEEYRKACASSPVWRHVSH